MTDKQIIIDGVDVSGCEFAEISNMIRPNQTKPSVKCKILKDLNQVFHCVCQHNNDCYFKQLARKTQECEELKKQLIQKDEVNTFFNTPIEGWDNDPCKICESKQNYDQIKAVKEQAEQKLERIKEFATALCYTVMSDGVVTLQKDILQIIDEVK